MRPTVILLIALTSCFAQAQQQTPATPSMLPGGADKWELIWSEEFDGTDQDLDKRWISQNGPSGHILSSRWRENVMVTNGLLRLVARKEKRGGQDWTAGSIWTRETFQYGYFECRYRYAEAEGLNNSFWLMPTGTNKMTRGKLFEIDINEGHFPDKLNINIHNHSDTHLVNGKRTHPTSPRKFTFSGKNFAREAHVYGLDWNENELVFYLDGTELRRVKNEFCHSPASIYLSLAVIPWAGKVTDAIDGKAMEVDHVRVYRRKQ
jgi:beta-glucanase (GH16 family)